MRAPEHALVEIFELCEWGPTLPYRGVVCCGGEEEGGMVVGRVDSWLGGGWAVVVSPRLDQLKRTVYVCRHHSAGGGPAIRKCVARGVACSM